MVKGSLLWSTNVRFPSDFYSRRGSKVNVSNCNKSQSVMGNQEIKNWKREELFRKSKNSVFLVLQKQIHHIPRTPAVCSFMTWFWFGSYWSSIVWPYEPCLFWQFKIKLYNKWESAGSQEWGRCRNFPGFLFKQKVIAEQHAVFLPQMMAERW